MVSPRLALVAIFAFAVLQAATAEEEVHLEGLHPLKVPQPEHRVRPFLQRAKEKTEPDHRVRPYPEEAAADYFSGKAGLSDENGDTAGEEVNGEQHRQKEHIFHGHRHRGSEGDERRRREKDEGRRENHLRSKEERHGGDRRDQRGHDRSHRERADRHPARRARDSNRRAEGHREHDERRHGGERSERDERQRMRSRDHNHLDVDLSERRSQHLGLDRPSNTHAVEKSIAERARRVAREADSDDADDDSETDDDERDRHEDADSRSQSDDDSADASQERSDAPGGRRGPSMSEEGDDSRSEADDDSDQDDDSDTKDDSSSGAGGDSDQDDAHEGEGKREERESDADLSERPVPSRKAHHRQERGEEARRGDDHDDSDDYRDDYRDDRHDDEDDDEMQGERRHRGEKERGHNVEAESARDEDELDERRRGHHARKAEKRDRHRSADGEKTHHEQRGRGDGVRHAERHAHRDEGRDADRRRHRASLSEKSDERRPAHHGGESRVHREQHGHNDKRHGGQGQRHGSAGHKHEVELDEHSTRHARHGRRHDRHHDRHRSKHDMRKTEMEKPGYGLPHEVTPLPKRRSRVTRDSAGNAPGAELRREARRDDRDDMENGIGAIVTKVAKKPAPAPVKAERTAAPAQAKAQSATKAASGESGGAGADVVLAAKKGSDVVHVPVKGKKPSAEEEWEQQTANDQSAAWLLQYGDYGLGQWNYNKNDDRSGPSGWQSLDGTYSMCGAGKHQSPVDISDDNLVVDSSLEDVQMSYRTAHDIDIHVSNRSMVLSLPQPSGSVVFDAVKYHLKQVHIHTPSEHLTNGTAHDAEVQLVHIDHGTGRMLVVSVLFDTGDNPVCHSLFDAVVTKSAADLTPSDIIPPDGEKHYYWYTGSVTTPPCFEGVQYIVMHKPRPMAREALAQLKKVVGGNNARPVQWLGPRGIFSKSTK